MKTISISGLKTHLSEELRRVKAGETLLVMEHRHPIAKLVPVTDQPLFAREAKTRYTCTVMAPLTDKDPARFLEEERSERW
jgi:antitoxin (DNA-binding transcriptional repressor) of toxin-antitoxin stability system